MAARPRRRGDRRARRRHRARRARLRPDPARAAPAGRRRPAPRRARRPRTARSPRCPRSSGAWRHRGGGCSYIPTATAAAISSVPGGRPDLRTKPARRINMSQLGDALCGDLDPPVRRSWCGTRTRRRSRPTRRRCWPGSARPDLFTVVLEQFMTDTAAHADVVLPATTQLEHLDVIFSWGHHYVTLSKPGDRAARRGQAEHGDLPAARRPARPRRPVLPRLRRGARRSRCSRRRPTTSRSTGSTSAAGRRSTSGRARCRTPKAASGRPTGSSTCTRSTSRRARSRTPTWPRASRSR